MSYKNSSHKLRFSQRINWALETGLTFCRNTPYHEWQCIFWKTNEWTNNWFSAKKKRLWRRKDHKTKKKRLKLWFQPKTCPLKKSQLQWLDFPHLSAEERFLFLRLVNHSSSCLFSPKNSEDRLGRKKIRIKNDVWYCVAINRGLLLT